MNAILSARFTSFGYPRYFMARDFCACADCCGNSMPRGRREGF